MKTNLWLTVMTIALVLNAVVTYTKVDGTECTAGIRKEHLDPLLAPLLTMKQSKSVVTV